MSIVAYTGLPGSGKSYGVVESVILPSLKAGRTIVTNIPLKIGTLGDDYPDGKIIPFASDCENAFFTSDNIVPGAVYVIDEAWRWFPSGLRANQVPNEEKQFFTEHRHFVGEGGMTCEIVIVTQNLNQIAMYVKALIEETYISRKLTALGQSKKFRIDVYAGVAEGVKPAGEVVRQLFGTYKKDVFKYYSSHTHNKTEYTTGEEKKVTDRTNIFKSWKFRFIVLFAPLMLFGGMYSAYTQLFGSDSLSSSSRSEAPTVASTDKVSPVSRSSGRTVAKLSESGQVRELARAVALDEIGYDYHPTARIAGIYQKPGGVSIQIDDSDFARSRFIPSYVCDFNALTESPVCVVDGLLVTQFTGSVESSSSDSSDPPSML
jgi:zona occludens toxin